MPRSGCSALHGVNPNYKKKKQKKTTNKQTNKSWVYNLTASVLKFAVSAWTPFLNVPTEQHSSKQGNILILKTVFISQNMFYSIHISSVAKSIIKTVNILNLHVS